MWVIKKPPHEEALISGDPAGIRTLGPNIKSVVLYQLSYEINLVQLIRRPYFLGVQKYSSNAFEPKVFVFWLKKFIGIDVDNLT